PSRLADRERRLRIPGEEQPLDRDEIRLVERDQLVEEAVDHEEPLRERGVRLRLEAARVDHPEAAAPALDDAPAEGGGAWVDAEDDHAADRRGRTRGTE